MSEQLHFGWTPDLDVPSALGRVPPERLCPLHVLVTMIDSTPRVRVLQSFLSILRELGADYVEVDDDVLIDVPTLFALIRDRCFLTGFDEVWLFEDPPKVGKPQYLRMTSDKPLRSGPSHELVTWMRDANCLAGLGDGDGLNFATSDGTLAALWKP